MCFLCQKNRYPDPMDYCESAATSGPFLQPMNTLSNIPLMLVGLYYLTTSGGDEVMSLYGLLVLLVGLASGIFHAFPSSSVSHIDFYLMNSLVGYMCLMSLDRYRATVLQPFLMMFLFVLIGCVDLTFFSCLISIYVGLTLKRGMWSRNYQIALATLCFALLIWHLSKTEGLLCFPESKMQGHAVWHAMIAVVLWEIGQFSILR